MALSEEEKSNILKLRQDLVSRTGPKARELERVINEVDLTGISTEDLKSLTNPRFTVGVNFNEIDTSGKFTTTDMNTIAPGSIDVNRLKAKLSNQSMLQARVTDVIDTQAGTMAVKNELKINGDVEDLIEAKTKSQGVNLQLINRAQNIDAQRVEGKNIKSKFLE